MKSKFLLFYLLVFILANSAQGLFSCSVFCASSINGPVIARTYDWNYNGGYIIINRANRMKKDLRYIQEVLDKGLQWKSKYASVSFNQYGHDVSFCGMNEAGLIINELWLDGTRYEPFSFKKSLSVDQLTQYMLDNFSTVTEIEAMLKKIRIRPTPGDFAKLHFFVTDRLGQCLVIEILEGKMIFHTNTDLPIKALTNDCYSDSLKKFNENSCHLTDSLIRFKKLSVKLSGKPIMNSETTQELIESVVRKTDFDPTQFIILFDPVNQQLKYRTAIDSRYRIINLTPIWQDNKKEDLMLPLNFSGQEITLNSFETYTKEKNEKMIEDSWINLGYNRIDLKALRKISTYPDSFSADKK